MALTFYGQLSIDKRKEVRKLVNDILQHQRQQKEAVIKGILKPIDDSIEACYSVLKVSNGMSLEEFHRRQKAIRTQIKGIFEGEKDNEMLLQDSD